MRLTFRVVNTAPAIPNPRFARWEGAERKFSVPDPPQLHIMDDPFPGKRIRFSRKSTPISTHPPAHINLTYSRRDFHLRFLPSLLLLPRDVPSAPAPSPAALSDRKFHKTEINSPRRNVLRNRSIWYKLLRLLITFRGRLSRGQRGPLARGMGHATEMKLIEHRVLMSFLYYLWLWDYHTIYCSVFCLMIGAPMAELPLTPVPEETGHAHLW